MPQAVGLPGRKPPPMLFVGSTEQQVPMGVPLLVGMFVGLDTMGTLALVYCILHKLLSHPIHD